MRFAFSALFLALSALPAQAEGYALRAATAQERAAVEQVLRAALPEAAVVEELSVGEIEADVSRACGYVRTQGEALPFAVALARTQHGESVGKLLGLPVDEMAAVSALKPCAEIGVTLSAAS